MLGPGVPADSTDRSPMSPEQQPQRRPEITAPSNARQRHATSPRFALRLMALAGLLAVGVLLSGCEYFSSPQNTFNPAGEVAQSQKDDFLFVMWPALVIGVLVMVGVVYIAVRYRHKPGDALPKQIHGNTALELTWTIIPIILLSVIAVPTVQGIRDLAENPGPDALQVQVTGFRFSWVFAYPEYGPTPEEPLEAPNVGELRIPVGRKVYLTINSTDVNHSFWVPKLAGKTDAIPNHTNHMWIKADEPGEYSGQCAEFCGLDHFNMRMTVIAMPEEEFNAWIEQQAALEAGDDGRLVSNGE